MDTNRDLNDNVHLASHVKCAVRIRNLASDFQPLCPNREQLCGMVPRCRNIGSVWKPAGNHTIWIWFKAGCVLHESKQDFHTVLQSTKPCTVHEASRVKRATPEPPGDTYRVRVACLVVCLGCVGKRGGAATRTGVAQPHCPCAH